MQEVREALEEIVMLADDASWSHAARMVKIKGLASRALTTLNDAPVKKGPGRPTGSKTGGGKTGDEVKESDTSPTGSAAS